MTLEEIIDSMRKSLIKENSELNYIDALVLSAEMLQQYPELKVTQKQLAVYVVHGINGKDILSYIATEYSLLVHTEYHCQIEVQGGVHDLWLGKSGLKIKLFGQHESDNVTSLSRLRQTLKGYDYGTTDRAQLMLLNRLITRSKGKKGIFTDAGWDYWKKIAKIAVIDTSDNGNMNLHIRVIENVDNSQIAEEEAIKLALELYPDGGPIFNDCQSAVQYIANPRVQWIPRESNTTADHFGNMRNKK